MFKKLYQSKKVFLDAYKNDLDRKGFPNATVKNYLTDIRQFVAWREKTKINNDDANVLLENFAKDIEDEYSQASVKRKMSSIKKYLRFEKNIQKAEGSEYHFSTIHLLAIFAFVILVAFSRIGNDLPKTEIGLIEKGNTIVIPGHITISSIPSSDVSTTIAKKTSGYSFDKQKGIQVVLSSEPNADTPNDVFVLSQTKTIEPLDETGEIIINDNSVSGGKGTIKKGSTDTIIVSEFINEDSFISFTPTSSTGNQNIYIKKMSRGIIVAGFDNPIDSDATFLWKVDNTEVYHSIL